MKVDLSKLTLARLKAYFKSLQQRCGGYEICDCGDLGCDHKMELSKNLPGYVEIKTELERVKSELGRRQKEIYAEKKKKAWANHVLDNSDYRRFGWKR